MINVISSLVRGYAVHILVAEKDLMKNFLSDPPFGINLGNTLSAEKAHRVV
jgi:hypothetical protein